MIREKSPRIGPHFSENGRKLLELAKEMPWNRLARRVGITGGALANVACGRMTASDRLKRELRLEYGLDLAGWDPVGLGPAHVPDPNNAPSDAPSRRDGTRVDSAGDDVPSDSARQCAGLESGSEVGASNETGRTSQSARDDRSPASNSERRSGSEFPVRDHGRLENDHDSRAGDSRSEPSGREAGDELSAGAYPPPLGLEDGSSSASRFDAERNDSAPSRRSLGHSPVAGAGGSRGSPPRAFPRAFPEKQGGEPTAAPADEDENPTSLLAMYRELYRGVEEDLHNARKKKTPARDLVPIVNTGTKLLQQIGKLTGELELTEAQVLRSPAFREVISVLKEALAKHPDAARDVALAFQRFRTEPGKPGRKAKS